MIARQAAQAPAISVATSTERLRCLLLWMTGASGAIVFFEPSPYELVSFLTLLIFAVGGISLSQPLLPLGLLLILINIGFSISAANVITEPGVVTWTITSWYLALTSLFFAAMLGANTQARLDAMARGCLMAGVIAAVAAIVGYLRIFPGADDLLLLYDRARGTFKDPNVLGAFLVFPILLGLQRVITGNRRQAVSGAMLLALFAAAILLSFSRAAWGQVVFASIVALGLTFATTRSPGLRVRIVMLTVAGVAVMAVFLAALLSIDSVGQLFQERASLDQGYDVGAQGRFARHMLGALLALDMPVGIGPLQFSKYFPEDPHNSYLNAFMAGGWLAGACYPALTVLTLVFGFRCVLVPTPWQQTAITVYAAYLGIAAESFIIDSDHWRHAFLLLGLMWGVIAVTRRHALDHALARENGAGLARQGSPA